MPTKSYTTRFRQRNEANYIDPTSGQPIAQDFITALTRQQETSSVPNWKTKVSKGLSATGVYVTSGTSVINYGHTIASASYWDKTLQKNVTHACREPVAMWLPVQQYYQPASAENEAKTHLFRQIKKEYQQFSAPTFFGELRETVRMLRRPAFALRRKSQQYVDLLRMKRRSVPSKDLPRVLADTYLEYAFGIVPLINDTKDAAIALARLIENPRRAKARGYGIQEGSLNAYNSNTWYPGGFFALIQSKDTAFTEVVINVGLNSALQRPPIAKVRELEKLCGFNPLEFVPTAWELLPWSFLVDYFSNVGDVLSSAFTDLSNVTWSTESIKQVTVKTLTARITSFNHNTSRFVLTSNAIGSQHWQSSAFAFQRKVPSLTPPTLEFSIPGMGTKWINMLALATSVRKLVPYR